MFISEFYAKFVSGQENRLFDALRRFAHLENNGARSLPEILKALPPETAPPEAAQ